MNGPHSSWSFRHRALLAAALGAAAVLAGLRFGEFPVGAGMDDAYYIELARSLAEGRGPVIHLGGAGPGMRPDIFPLGFPLLLSPLARWAPASVTVFKLVPLLAAAVLVLLCLRLARRAGVRRELELAALVILNPWVIAYSVRVFSDLPFTAVSVAAVLMFLRLDDRPRPGGSLFTGLVLCTGAAVMIRTIGLALPAAMLAVWIIRRRWRRALVFAGGLAAVLMPYAAAVGGSGGGLVTRAYLSQVFGGGEAAAGRMTLAAGNLTGYLKELPVILVPAFGNPWEELAARLGAGSAAGPVQLILGAGLLAAAVRGLVVTARTDRTRALFLGIYLAVYGGVLLSFAGYPSGVQTRLLLPVLPLLYLLLLAAADATPGLAGRRLAPAAVALVLACSLGHNAYRVARPLSASGEFIDPVPGAAWITSHTDPADVVMARWPLRQHIHFRRRVVGFGTAPGEDFLARIARYQVGYVVLDSGRPGPDTVDRETLLAAGPGPLREVYRDPGTGLVIFRVATGP